MAERERLFDLLRRRMGRDSTSAPKLAPGRERRCSSAVFA